MNHPGRPGCAATAPPVDSPPPLEAQDVPLDSPQAPPTRQALSLVDPESWASVGALSQTDSACWPAFIFLFKTLLDKRAFGLKRSEKVILASLFFGKTGGSGEDTELFVTMLLILTLDVKLQMLIINKIYIQS